MNHVLGDLVRANDRKWQAWCACGWSSALHRQRRFSMAEYADHVFEMTETSLKGSNQ